MNEALISVIIPTYNRANLLGETLESVLNQTYDNWECIVVDDGSTDQTKLLLEFYCKRDNRIHYYHRPGSLRKGASSCRNYGLTKSKGDLIQFLDSDDLLASNKLAEQVKFYEPGKMDLWTCKWGGFTDPQNLTSLFKYRYQSYRDFSEGIQLLNTFGLFNEFFPLHVYLTPKKLIVKAGSWNTDLTNNDDAEFFARVILNAAHIKFAPEAAVYYRYNSEKKLSDIDTPEKLDSFLKSLELISKEIANRYKNNKGYYVKRARNNLSKFLINNHLKFSGKKIYLKDENEDFDSFSYSVRRKAMRYLNFSM